jgi:hypothetical protein
LNYTTFDPRYDPRNEKYSKRTAINYEDTSNPYSGMSNAELMPLLDEHNRKVAAKRFLQQNRGISKEELAAGLNDLMNEDRKEPTWR